MIYKFFYYNNEKMIEYKRKKHEKKDYSYFINKYAIW